MKKTTITSRVRKFAFLIVAATTLVNVAFDRQAWAEDTLRVGKAIAQAFSFVPLDVGMQMGIFKKHGLKIEEFAFAGSAKLQQGLASDSIDIGLGSGPELAFVAKGAPVLGVAAMAGPPLLLVLVVRKDGPIHTVEALKGKTVSVSTVGSLTNWLVHELSVQQGWGPNGIKTAPLGAQNAQAAALKTSQVDGMVIDVGGAYRLEEAGAARILVRFGNLVKDFHIHVIYATRTILAKHPDAVRRFLAGWFETIAFMRKNKAATLKIYESTIGVSSQIADRVYDEVMPMFSDDGKYNPKALQVLARSYVEMGMLPKKPDMGKLITEQYLPPASK